MQGTMLAARVYPGETGFRLESVPIPPIESGEVLVRVHAAGLTHGLLSLWHNGRTQLLSGVLGHEAAGAVAEIGPGAKRWSCSSSCAPDGWTFSDLFTNRFRLSDINSAVELVDSRSGGPLFVNIDVSDGLKRKEPVMSSENRGLCCTSAPTWGCSAPHPANVMSTASHRLDSRDRQSSRSSSTSRTRSASTPVPATRVCSSVRMVVRPGPPRTKASRISKCGAWSSIRPPVSCTSGPSHPRSSRAQIRARPGPIAAASRTWRSPSSGLFQDRRTSRTSNTCMSYLRMHRKCSARSRRAGSCARSTVVHTGKR
ncbi:MAG: alcohol dehydrogenase catalytic domain-containing protein [Chloroflexi bacterium]|nr:alcohol dehydrogenase catalytic domain-containing protein [Chloroflexota bacterium]